MPRFSRRICSFSSPLNLDFSTREVEKSFCRNSLSQTQGEPRCKQIASIFNQPPAFSKKLENLQAAVALHFAHYNLVRLHKTKRIAPAMVANVTGRIWSLEELVERTSN